jgi:hypothetical protein
VKFLLSVVFNFKDYSDRPALPPVRSSDSAQAVISTKNGKKPTQKMIRYRISLLEKKARKNFEKPENVLTRCIAYNLTKLEKRG